MASFKSEYLRGFYGLCSRPVIYIQYAVNNDYQFEDAISRRMATITPYSTSLSPIS